MAFLNIAPTGTVLPFAGSTAPEGWLICQATAVSRTTYAALFAVIGTTYGTGDGSTTFNLPDMRGVFPRGSGTNGTGNYGGATGHTPAGGSIGNKGRQLTRNNGLSASASSSSASVAGAKNQLNNSTGSASNSSWTTEVSGAGDAGLNWFGHVPRRGTTVTGGSQSSFPGQDHSHSFSYGGDFSASGTAAAQTITVAAGDTETTPAFLALNYIIKL